MIAEGRYSDAYMINWKSNGFPEFWDAPAIARASRRARRGRVEETPVAICRLKRVAADFKDDVKHRMPKPLAKNGKRIAWSRRSRFARVARDLARSLSCTVFDADPRRAA